MEWFWVKEWAADTGDETRAGLFPTAVARAKSLHEKELPSRSKSGKDL
jgi:hypothetical protein